MKGTFKKIDPIEYHSEELSPEKQILLREANLQTLIRLYERCYKEGIPWCALIDAIEKEIYLKTIKEIRWKIDCIYRLEKFVPKQKKDHHEQQLRK